MRPFRIVLFVLLLSAGSQSTSAQVGQHPMLRQFLGRVEGAIREEANDIRSTAMQVYQTAPRQGSSAERQQKFLAILPEALRLSEYARDIYTDGADDRMAAAGADVLSLGSGRTSYRSTEGRRYAEVRVDSSRNQVVVVFRGTRVTVGSDIYTDVANQIGIGTGYYSWAADLVAAVVRKYPGWAVVATGQSLGGGLAIYAVLRNPGVTGFAFNPAGLSLPTWSATTAAQRARTNAALTVVSTRNQTQIEPITGLSLAGRSVLPGHLFVILTDVQGERILHGPSTIVEALKNLSSSSVSGPACDADIGVLAHP